MFTPAISLIDESEPQPLLRLPHDSQTHPKSELQQQLQVNLQNEIASVTNQIEQPELREIAQDILGSSFDSSIGWRESKIISVSWTLSSSAFLYWKSSNSRLIR